MMFKHLLHLFLMIVYTTDNGIQWWTF